MPDTIQVLPDHIANQIAAGEVIQRPGSAVKELMENAIDAKATEIHLIVNDAGKALVQVIDNGSGMSPTDARMAFERHATSKIGSIEDLFRLRTMGFRGEALASIGAVAQVELKTRREQDELGTYILMENSMVQVQEPVQSKVGTSVSMKNVFFNVPARRNFLKSNTAELRNIIDEFTRVSLAFPQIRFTLTSNGQQVYMLEKGSLKQRIMQLLGNQYNTKLVMVKEETDYLTIHGFVGKPDTARKTRGDQYFFVNNRFIKSAYLNHAVTHAFEDLLPKDSFASYVLFIDLNPELVDINVHPTKQEVKFEDEKIVYAFVQAAIKHALAQFSIAPSLDFSLNPDIQKLDAIQKPLDDQQAAQTFGGQLYKTFTQKNQAHAIEGQPAFKPWKEMQHQHLAVSQAAQNSKTAGPQQAWQSELAKLRAQIFETDAPGNTERLEYEQQSLLGSKAPVWLPEAGILQLHNRYVVASVPKGFVLVNQQAAHERIIYENLVKAMQGKPVASQQSLFPVTIQATPQDAILLHELLPELNLFGFQIEDFGNNSFVIHGTPADVETGNEQVAIDQILERYKNFNSEFRFGKRERLIRTLAWQQSIKWGKSLSEKEAVSLLEKLFACEQPTITPGGKPTFVQYTLSELDAAFA